MPLIYVSQDTKQQLKMLSNITGIPMARLLSQLVSAKAEEIIPLNIDEELAIKAQKFATENNMTIIDAIKSLTGDPEHTTMIGPP